MDKRLLSTPQQNIWYTKKVFNTTTITNVGAVYKLKGFEFVPELWTQAINSYLKTNDPQRIRIVDGIEPEQYTVEFKEEDFEIVDLSTLSEVDRYELYEQWIRETLTDQLYKFRILKFSDNESGFFNLKDHIITDATSETLMFEQIVTAYSCLIKGQELIEEKTPPYSLLLDREAKYRQGKRYEQDGLFWEEEYTDIPTCVSMSHIQTDNLKANIYRSKLDSKLTSEIQKFGQETGITPAVFFEALVFAYLKAISDEEKITIGMAVSSRTNLIEKKASGMYVHTLPFSVDVPLGMPFLELCRCISAKKMKVFRHHQYPYMDIQKNLNERFGYNGRLFDVVFSYQPAVAFGKEEKLDCQSEWIPSGYLNNGISIHVDDRDGTGEYSVNIEYQIDAFTHAQVENILDRLVSIAGQVLKDKDISLSDIDILMVRDHQNYAEFNQGILDILDNQIPITKNVVQLFEEQVEENPEKCALIFDGHQFTYNQLNRASNSLAWTIKSLGLKKGSIIPIVGERSFYTIVSLLAVAKAGYTYCLLDTKEYPNDWIDSLIKTCNSEVFIEYEDCSYASLDAQALNILKEGAWSNNYVNPEVDIRLDDIFCILTTSGTSGVPKAVRISHAAAANMAKNNSYLLDGCDYCIGFIPMPFDAFLEDTLMPLLNGKTYVLSTVEEQKSPVLTHKLLGQYANVFTMFTPTKLKRWLDQCQDDSWRNVRALMVGGEPFGEDLIFNLRKYSSARIFNQYGPTETTVFNSCKEISDNGITVGRPTPNFQILILNKAGQLLPPGVVGEIVPIGIGVASGYLNNEEQNAAFFMVNGQRAYRTGDCGIINENNELIIGGRNDDQEKINGVRFEPKGIENIMKLFPGIRLAAVTTKKHSGKAYVVGYYESESEIDEVALTEFLESKLPPSIIPSCFIRVDKMPTTISDKLIKSRLPEPDFGQLFISNDVLPKNEMQAALCAIWSKILNQENIGINTSWKHLGGNSIDALIMLDSIESKFGIRITPSDLPKSPTIEFLANILCGNVKKTDIPEDYGIKNLIINSEVDKTGNAILLTGATGFLGSHMLSTLLKSTNQEIYCLVRDERRFIEIIKHYFGNRLDSYQSRIHLIKGDLAKDNFGLSQETYDFLKREVSIVVNPAANVKHYGPVEDFKGINVDGVFRLIKFCAEANARLHHISTISVSGQGMTVQSRDKVVFTEKDLDVGQSYKDNIYIWTKYVGEKLIRDYQAIGGEACVYRIGHIGKRSYDGMFQYNAEESGFKLLIEAITELGILPENLEKLDMPSVAVDDCAAAISLLINLVPMNQTYHIYDSQVKTLREYMIMHHIPYKRVSLETFMERLIDFIQSDNKYALIAQYIKGFENGVSTHTVDSTETDIILEAIGFEYRTFPGGAKGDDSDIYMHTFRKHRNQQNF